MPESDQPAADPYRYQLGLGNFFLSETHQGIVPWEQNTPQSVPKGLVAEQISLDRFTNPRGRNAYAWLYRLYPSISLPQHFMRHDHSAFRLGYLIEPSPEPYRWNPLSIPQQSFDFITGLKTVGATFKDGSAPALTHHVYAAITSMGQKAFSVLDGEVLILPESGALDIRTEFGCLLVKPGELVVIPQGVWFSVQLVHDAPIRGYMFINASDRLHLPDGGIVGPNGSVDPLHFKVPVASVDLSAPYELIKLSHGKLYRAKSADSPFNVFGWKGNAYPYKYDLGLFKPINYVDRDHLDPSIFTVLVSSACDVAVFPPRWNPTQHTFRPPYFHRNARMNEFMGLIHGRYEAKADGRGGFQPGGFSMHPAGVPHGPDAETYFRAIAEDQSLSARIDHTLAFMIESEGRFMVNRRMLTSQNMGGLRQDDYAGYGAEIRTVLVKPGG